MTKIFWLGLKRNYHSKQSSTRADGDYIVVSQHKGKVFMRYFCFNKCIFRDQCLEDWERGGFRISCHQAEIVTTVHFTKL